VELLKIFVAER